jgi:hypothetical protein
LDVFFCHFHMLKSVDCKKKLGRVLGDASWVEERRKKQINLLASLII